MANGASSSLCLDTPDLFGCTGGACETLQNARRLLKVDASTCMAECHCWMRAQRLPGPCDVHGSWCPWGHGSGVAPVCRHLRGAGDPAVRTWRGTPDTTSGQSTRRIAAPRRTVIASCTVP